MDPARLLALHNETFREIPNTLPLELADLEWLVRGAFAGASSVITDGDRYAGHLIALRYADGPEPYAEIDVVGVGDAYRRRGLGRAMIARALGAAHREGLLEMRALVSSLNAGSLELHRHSGFWRAGANTRASRRFVAAANRQQPGAAHAVRSAACGRSAPSIETPAGASNGASPWRPSMSIVKMSYSALPTSVIRVKPALTRAPSWISRIRSALGTRAARTRGAARG